MKAERRDSLESDNSIGPKEHRSLSRSSVKKVSRQISASS